MKKYITIILLFFQTLVSAQNTENPLNDYILNFHYQKALEYIATQEPTKELLLQQAMCYKALGNYQIGVNILQTLSVEYPENIRIKSELANCYTVLGRRQEGIDCYDDLIHIDSANLYYKIQKAELLYQQGKCDKALDMFYTVYNHNQSPNTLTQIAQCYEKMNQADSAMVYFKGAWEANPFDSFSAVSLVNLCLKNKRIPEALAYSAQYMESDTTNQQMNLLNALTYYVMDNYEESVVRFKKCYEAGDSSLVVNRSLGISYYSLKENYEAEIYLDKAFKQDTTNNNVLYCLAMSSNELADHKKAIPLFKKILDRTIPPDLTLYLYYKGLASAYDKGSHFEDAVNTYIEASNYGGANQKMTTYYRIADLYENRLNNNTDALVYYRLYRTSLDEYLESLRQKENAENADIEDTLSRIKFLEEHLIKLEGRKPKI